MTNITTCRRCDREVPPGAVAKGHDVCYIHFVDEGEYTVTAVGIDALEADQAVIAQYNQRNRWNGWLVPKMDPLGIVNFVERVINSAGDPDNMIRLEWLDDGTLVVHETWGELQDGEDYEPERITPDEDGLYDFMGGYWTWEGCEDFYDVVDGTIVDRFTEEWKAWNEARNAVGMAAHNANNRALARAGVMNRYDSNDEARRLAQENWEASNPEPDQYR